MKNEDRNSRGEWATEAGSEASVDIIADLKTPKMTLMENLYREKDD